MSRSAAKQSKIESKAGSLVGSFVESKNPVFEGEGEVSRADGVVDLERTKFSIGKWNISEKNYLLYLFVAINFFLFADQNLLAPNLSVIAEEFNMTDDERDQYLGGYISLGFFVIGGIVAMLVGYLADTVDRKAVFAITVCIGELSCMATYWIPVGSIAQFWSGLWLTRAITGVALGGALPIQFSLLGDIFSEDERGTAVAVIAVATHLGGTAGQYLANVMSPDFRTPFLLVSVPSFLLVALYCATTPQPKRGQAEKLMKGRQDKLSGEEHKISWKKLQDLTKTPSALLVVAQGLFGTLPWGVVGVFVNDYLLEEKEQSSLQAANIMLMFGMFSAVSTLFGGVFVDRYMESHPRYLPLGMGFTTLIAPIPFMILLLAPKMTAGAYAVLMIPAALIAGFAGPIVKGILIHVTLPETRGTAFAFQTLMDELGKGLGPFIISSIIGFVPNRQTGLVIGILGWIPCAMIMLSVVFFIEDDRRKYLAALAEAYHIDDLTEGELEVGQSRKDKGTTIVEEKEMSV